MNKLIFIGLATALLASCNSSTQSHKEMTTPKKEIRIVEITTFKLNQGVTNIDFEQSARAMQKDFLEKQNGFIKRTLTVSQDSIWTDVVFWQDEKSAATTMKLAETSELVLPFMKKINFNSIKMNLTTPILIEE
jgi:hypothetical protein